MQVQHPVPTAVHDGSCFQEEENDKVPIQDDVPAATTKVEEAAPGAEQVQAPVNNGVSEEQTKGQEEDSSKENNPKDLHKDVPAVATDDAGDGGECQVQAVAQEVQAKLGLGTVVDSAAPEVDDEAKLPKEEEAERRREVPRKAVAAKAVVVPVDDDDGLIDDDGEPAAPQEAAAEAPEEEKDAEGEGEELKEEKAHEE